MYIIYIISIKTHFSVKISLLSNGTGERGMVERVIVFHHSLPLDLLSCVCTCTHVCMSVCVYITLINE